MHWVDKALEEIEKQYDNSEISAKEYRELERDIYNELEAQAEEAAEQTRHDILGY